MRLRAIGSRIGERPAMDGRAGVWRSDVVSPWMAVVLNDVSMRLRAIGSRIGERPTMDGRAGAWRSDVVSQGMAAIDAVSIR
jgi:hypothetical protein